MDANFHYFDTRHVRPSATIPRIADLRPGTPDPNWNIPSLRQCVGTNRLWGAMLGLALHDDLGKQSPSLQDLVDIAVMSRTILVLDDFLDDESTTGEPQRYCSIWLDALLEQMVALYSKLGEDFFEFDLMRKRGHLAFMARQDRNAEVDLFTSSIEKCLIFFNPYRLSIAKHYIRLYEKRLVFLENMFFACQLLDDFQDLEEDFEKPTNQNLFYYRNSTSDCVIVRSHKAYLARSIIRCVLNNLKSQQVFEGVRESRVMEYYFRAALWYLNEKDSALMIYGIDPTISSRNFYEWRLLGDSVTFLRDSARKVSEMGSAEGNTNTSTNTISGIRPEFLQTAMMGCRHILEV